MAGREGATVGPYRLTRRLGAGGAGEVYLADGPAQGGASRGPVAVKVLRGGAGDPTTREIARQVHAVTGLHQTHVLPIYGVGEDQGAIYVAMAYAPGGSLNTIVQPDGIGALQLPLSAGVVARLVTQIARALQAAHERGLAHGDLKLSNVFVRTAPGGGPLTAVGDFGQSVVVSAAAAAASSMSANEAAWATDALRCAAPEQLQGHVMPASDQYALATIAYLLLTGQFPFSGDARALGTALLQQAPPPPTHIDPTLAPAAEAVLLRALSKSPQSRFPDIASFAQALNESLLVGAPGTSVTVEFSQLAGGGSAAASTQHGPTPSSSLARAGASGVRMRPGAAGQASPAASGGRLSASQAPVAGGLVRSLTGRQKMLAIVAAIAMVGLVTTGIVGLGALATAGGPRTPLPNFGGLDYAPTTTPNAAQIAQQHQIAQTNEALLAAAISGQPVFSDTLANNSQNWSVDGKQFFFGSDNRLHVFNTTPQSVATINQPVAAPTNFVVMVNMTFLRGSLSDVAGLRVRVAPDANGALTHFTVLISPEGRFQFWHFDGTQWNSLDNGYTPAVNRGFGAVNQIAVMGKGNGLWLFVNGHFVTLVHFGTAVKGAATMGLSVIYSGCEVTYDHYAVYSVAS